MICNTFEFAYNDVLYNAVVEQDNSGIVVMKGGEKVDYITPSVIQGMFWNGTPKNITFEVALMLAYKENCKE